MVYLIRSHKGFILCNQQSVQLGKELTTGVLEGLRITAQSKVS